jgi:hypothetical protein
MSPSPPSAVAAEVLVMPPPRHDDANHRAPLQRPGPVRGGVRPRLRFQQAAQAVIAKLPAKKRAANRQNLIEGMMGLHVGKGDESTRAAALLASRITVAASLVMNSMDGTYDPKWPVRGAGWRKVQSWVGWWPARMLRYFMLFAFMMLPFWEQPIWCRIMDRQQLWDASYDNYDSIAQTGSQMAAVDAGYAGITPDTNPRPQSLDDMPPCGAPLVFMNSHLTYMPIVATLVLELLLLVSLFLTETLLRLYALGCRAEIKRDPCQALLLLLFSLSILDVLFSFGFIDTQTVRVMSLLRPFLFVILVPSIRSSAMSLVRGLPAIGDVLALLWIVIFLYAWVGVLFFHPVNSREGAGYFFDFQEALWTIQVQLTTVS